jgi:hypothetical protein
VQLFLKNVLDNGGLFGELDWAGGTIEWCPDGTCHLHLIAAMKRVAPKKMEECFNNADVKNRLEEWIGSLFCENNCHPDGALLGLMEESGKLLHMNTLLCLKYQKTNAKGECKCRFEFGRPLCKPDNGQKAKCVLNAKAESWHWSWNMITVWLCVTVMQCMNSLCLWRDGELSSLLPVLWWFRSR